MLASLTRTPNLQEWIGIYRHVPAHILECDAHQNAPAEHGGSSTSHVGSDGGPKMLVQVYSPPRCGMVPGDTAIERTVLSPTLHGSSELHNRNNESHQGGTPMRSVQKARHWAFRLPRNLEGCWSCGCVCGCLYVSAASQRCSQPELRQEPNTRETEESDFTSHQFLSPLGTSKVQKAMTTQPPPAPVLARPAL